nr:AMIN domain-containing protein [uncultured Desulfobulbus sp.]
MNTKIFAHLSRSLLILLCMLGMTLAAETPRLQQISHSVLSSVSEQVVLKLNGSYSPKAFTLKGQSPRLVFDFADMTQARQVKNLTQLTGPFLKSIRVGMHTGTAAKTRIVFDLKTLDNLSYHQSFNQANSTLTVRFTTKKTVAPSPAPAAATSTVEKLEKPITPSAVPSSIVQKPHSKTERAPIPSEQSSVSPKPVKRAKDSSSAQAQVKIPKPEPAAPPKVEQKVATAQTTKTQEPEIPSQKARVQADTKPLPPPNKPAKEVKQTNKKLQTAVQPKPESLLAPPKRELLSVKFDPASPKGEMVMFKLNGFYPPSVHGVEEGIPRVICDFNKTTLTAETKKRILTDGKYVKALRISTTKKPEKVRVVIDLEPNHSYDLQQVFFKDDNLFVIIVNILKK